MFAKAFSRWLEHAQGARHELPWRTLHMVKTVPRIVYYRENWKNDKSRRIFEQKDNTMGGANTSHKISWTGEGDFEYICIPINIVIF